MPAVVTYKTGQIRALREGLGLSIDEFAERLGVTKQAVSKWETGTAKPHVDTITKIVNEFGVKVDSFWGVGEGK